MCLWYAQLQAASVFISDVVTKSVLNSRIEFSAESLCTKSHKSNMASSRLKTFRYMHVWGVGQGSPVTVIVNLNHPCVELEWTGSHTIHACCNDGGSLTNPGRFSAWLLTTKLIQEVIAVRETYVMLFCEPPVMCTLVCQKGKSIGLFFMERGQ